MFASLTGTVTAIRLDAAIIDVGGVGFLVHTTPATLAALQVGTSATLATHLVVREDALVLYGFTEAADRDLFTTLQTVSGIGPRIGLAMLAVLDHNEIRTAIETADYATLQRVPGIGRKSAQRIVLELAGKLGPADIAAVSPAAQDMADEVTAALVGLGWTEKAASAAVAAVDGDDVSAMLRAALRHLGGHRE
jgi:Holliday junction DNA helicase RuvA